MGIENMSTPQKVVEFVALASSQLDKALQQDQVKEAQDKAISDLVPSVVKELILHGRIQQHQEKDACEALKDPVRALELLRKLASHKNQDEMSQLGESIPQAGKQKIASTANPFVGARGNGDLKESDMALFRGLGLTATGK